MKTIQKTHVHFMLLGGEETDQEVKSRDLNDLVLPVGATAFYFYDSLEVEILHGEEKKKLSSDEILNPSPMFIVGAMIVSKEDFLKDFPTEMHERLQELRESKCNSFLIIDRKQGSVVAKLLLPYDPERFVPVKMRVEKVKID
jgi:hypothetical protein